MGCVTLLSDFGLYDCSVAAAKGIMLQHLPGIPVMDITHNLEPYHTQQAAYVLLSAYHHFPLRTCHIVLFDVFANGVPRMVLCEKNSHYFLAPDNGVLPLAFGNDLRNVWQCYEMEDIHSFKDWMHTAGSIATQLQMHTPAELNYTKCRLKKAPQRWQPKLDENMAECHVVYIDRYENVVVGITREQFEACAKGRKFSIEFMRGEQINEITTHFHKVPEGHQLCRFNASGYLEIAINRGKAASLFGFKVHREKHFIYNTIKIYFSDK